MEGGCTLAWQRSITASYGWLAILLSCALAAAPTWLQRCLRLGRGRIWICISWEKGCMRSRNGPFLLSFRSIFSLRPSFFRSAPSSFLPSWSGLAALGAWGSSLHCRHIGGRIGGQSRDVRFVHPHGRMEPLVFSCRLRSFSFNNMGILPPIPNGGLARMAHKGNGSEQR